MSNSFIVKTTIINALESDIDEIFRLYDLATKHQISINAIAIWPNFDRHSILQEIKEKRQWKLMIDNQIACIWATAYSDPDIWEERNNDAAIYIHRIATNPCFRGNQFVLKIVEWAKSHAIHHHKQFIRLDTVGNNIGLIQYYQQTGFTYLGQFKLKNTKNLYGHYKKDAVCLFEINLDRF